MYIIDCLIKGYHSFRLSNLFQIMYETSTNRLYSKLPCIDKEPLLVNRVGIFEAYYVWVSTINKPNVTVDFTIALSVSDLKWQPVCVCVCVCVCVYIYICIYIYMYVCVCACVRACVRACVCVCCCCCLF